MSRPENCTCAEGSLLCDACMKAGDEKYALPRDLKSRIRFGIANSYGLVKPGTSMDQFMEDMTQQVWNECVDACAQRFGVLFNECTTPAAIAQWNILFPERKR